MLRDFDIMKKAVEISLNTVIVAAIALIVLIVIVVIFTNQSGKTVRGINDCAARGGDDDGCKATVQECVSSGGIPAGECIFYDSSGERSGNSRTGYVCCVYNS